MPRPRRSPAWPRFDPLVTNKSFNVIIFRYLAKEVLASMLAVSAVLLLIIMSGRFVRYLADAAAGKLDAQVLLTLMGYRLPSFLELILPLGFFIGILLAYGRLYVDSEMTVLSACGMSERRLVGYTLATGSFVAVIVAILSLYVSPVGVKAAEDLFVEQRNRTEFETLKPARFHKLSSRDGVTYAQSVSADKKQLQQVFIAGTAETSDKLSVVTAATGETLVNQVTGKRYLVLQNGQQYRGQPGDADYEVITFSRYSQYVPEPDFEARPKKATDGLSTMTLWKSDTREANAALQWRLSLPVLVLVVALLAVPLSRTQPRKGRYVKMIPAILLYIIYLVVSNAARGLMEEGKAPIPYLLWWVHAVFLLLALTLLLMPSWLRFHRRPSQAAPA
ncbi:LPS export ABC transporter permease LptF [Saccharophagus sp. K07]|uniref:LPS export ABC transporter permease LptF n=1 Tax=Saccharophagus sp. K07 TaxID=2283636 RepID=UPI001CA383EA|nr:LPS export ABC transporter permease LptF [Saccharophagus sp. K07]